MAGIVDIVVGSENDVDLVEASGALDVLGDCGVEWHFHIISAHRHPKVLHDYCQAAVSRGVGVMIAAAGGSAALPGDIASELRFTPIIGVALPSKEFPNAMDALLSMVRMPGGCPVLVAGIGKAGLKNAAIAAIQILTAGKGDISVVGTRRILELCLGGKGPKPQLDYRSSLPKKKEGEPKESE